MIPPDPRRANCKWARVWHGGFCFCEDKRVSYWRCVDTDEIWLFHASALLILSMAKIAAGPWPQHHLGPNVLGNDAMQLVVPEGGWQVAQSIGDWSLVSCTVSPGFDFAGFQLAASGFDIRG